MLTLALVAASALGALAAMGYAVSCVCIMFGRRRRGAVVDTLFGIFVVFACCGAVSIATALTVALERCP